jgi:hypothetical protein
MCPISAVVEPFSAEEVARHTPGDAGRQKLEEERAKEAEKSRKGREKVISPSDPTSQRTRPDFHPAFFQFYF